MQVQTLSIMLKINSNEEMVSATPEKVYQVLTSFFSKPIENIPGVENWETFENGCRFNVQGQVACQLTLSEQVPYSRVTYMAETDKSISAVVSFDITPSGTNSLLQGNADINVPFFLQGMVKGMINKFMDTAMQYLKTAIENS